MIYMSLLLRVVIKENVLYLLNTCKRILNSSKTGKDKNVHV